MGITFFYIDTYWVVLLGFIILTWIILNLTESVSDRVAITKIIIITFFLFCVIFWGARPWYVGVDTGNYIRRFTFAQGYGSLKLYLDSLDGDYVFAVIVYFISRIGNRTIFFLIISFLTIGGFYIFFRKLLKHNSYTIIGVLMVASAFTFINLMSNVIRNGLAVALFIPCTYYLFKKKYKQAVFWGLVSYMSHQSILLPVVGLLIVYLVRIPLKYYVLGYIVSSILAMANIGLHSFGFIQQLGIGKLNGYINSEVSSYRTGFRPDFFGFNTFFLMLFLIIARNHNGIQYLRYLKLYIIMSCFFFMAFGIPFSDRFGIYSWVFMPIVLFLGVQYYDNKNVSGYSLTMKAMFLFYFLNLVLYIFTTPRV